MENKSEKAIVFPLFKSSLIETLNKKKKKKLITRILIVDDNVFNTTAL